MSSVYWTVTGRYDDELLFGNNSRRKSRSVLIQVSLKHNKSYQHYFVLKSHNYCTLTGRGMLEGWNNAINTLTVP